MRLKIPARYHCRYPFDTPRGTVDTIEEIDLAHTAFLVVDVYGLGHDPGDPVPEMPPLFLRELHRLQGKIIRERIGPTLEMVRAHRMPVVYTENMWRPSAWGNSEFGQLVERTESGNTGSFDQVYIGSDYNRYSKVIAPTESDFVVQKTMYDSFFETTLDTVLRNLGVKYLICAGFTADICLLQYGHRRHVPKLSRFRAQGLRAGFRICRHPRRHVHDQMGDPLLRGDGRLHDDLERVRVGSRQGEGLGDRASPPPVLSCAMWSAAISSAMV